MELALAAPQPGSDDPIRMAIGRARTSENPALLQTHKIFSCGFTRML
jgi:hypothetical protein